ncbi:MAG: hypothetical protein RRC07_13965 [Anaerolineae bacterium]|nr:hypothetical protein [Anaerolineae bacterium]
MELIPTFSSGDTITLVILTIILLAVLLVLRFMFKLTATLFRLGCLVIAFIVGAVALLFYLA